MEEAEAELLLPVSATPISPEKHVTFAPLPVDETYPFARPVLLKFRSTNPGASERILKVEFAQLRTPYFRQRPKWFAYLLVVLLLAFLFFIVYWFTGKLLLLEIEEQIGKAVRSFDAR
jgi:hypothetical protein